MINKGMVNKGKYWIYGKNKGIPVYNFEEPKGCRRAMLSFFVDIIPVSGAKNV